MILLANKNRGILFLRKKIPVDDLSPGVGAAVRARYSGKKIKDGFDHALDEEEILMVIQALAKFNII